MNRLAMCPLARHLRRHGHAVHLVAHDSVTGDLARSAGRLARAVEAVLQGTGASTGRTDGDARRSDCETPGARSGPHGASIPVAARADPTALRLAFVGHSLGGLVVLDALRRHPGWPPADVILLGVPFQGAAASTALRRLPIVGRHLARGLHDWSQQRAADSASAPACKRLCTLAGTQPLGLGRLLCRLDGPNDGTVTVAETVVPYASEAMHLPVSHTGMLFSRDVATQVLSWLGGSTPTRSP